VKIHRGEDMKIVNVVLVIVSILVLVGLFYNGVKEDDTEPIITGSSNTEILSLDLTIFKIEGDYIYILEGTAQEYILNNVTSNDSTPQSDRITTNEGFEKSLDEIFEYDRLYVTAENGGDESYYTILYTDSLD